MNQDPAKLSLSNFLAGESNDALQAPASFTNWMRVGAWAVELYEPELLASADARTLINYGGKPRSVINLCSYNYLGLANHPEVLAASHEALRTHGMGACGSPMLSGMTDLHRELERRVAKFLNRDDAMLFNSGFGGALGTISGICRKCLMWRMLTARAFSLTKRIRCSRVVRTVGELLSTSALKTGSRWCTARFQKRSERWAVLSPVRRRRFSICVFTRIRTC